MRIRSWILLAAFLVLGCSDADDKSPDSGQADMGSDISIDQNETEDLGSDAADADLGAGENDACEETSDCLSVLVCAPAGFCVEKECSLDCPRIGSCEAGVVSIPPGGTWEGRCGDEPECPETTTEECKGDCLSGLTDDQKYQATLLAENGDLSGFCTP